LSRKPTNTRVPADMVDQVDKVVGESRGVYRDRSHFIELAIREKLEREPRPQK
jgi:Arc/MetJ-type ribon-helix-helix transcriptional regulator